MSSIDGHPSEPASEALAGTLDTDSNLTLGKKKSWFGSLRNIVSKGALSTKAAVDSIRTEQTKAETHACLHSKLEKSADQRSRDSQVDDERTAEISARRSTDSGASTTPLVKSGTDRSNTPPSKSALASLRNHLPHHGSKHHHKRSSLCSVSARPSSAMSEIVGPETIVASVESNGSSAGHGRKSSLANSLVGSLRGIGRKSKLAPAESEPSEKEVSPEGEDKADSYPLPSSPINIPTIAPALELDLGPAGFMSPIFQSPSAKDLKREELKLEDPANITGVPKSYRLHHVLDERKSSPNDSRKATTRSDLLATQHKLTDETDDSQPVAPATPMPGTNFSLEIDGANSDRSDKTLVFERSVTPVGERERKELRTMRSLDAMAESCAIAHANDEAETTAAAEVAHEGHAVSSIETPCRPKMSNQGYFDNRNARRSETDVILPKDSVRNDRGVEPTNNIFTSLPESQKIPDSPELRFYTPRRQSIARSTTQPCPGDLEQLSRQKAQQPFTEHDGTGDSAHGGQDPFIPDLRLGFGPPWPTRSLDLPFRPKTSSDESTNGSLPPFTGATQLGKDTKVKGVFEDTVVATPPPQILQASSGEADTQRHRHDTAESTCIYYERRTTAWGDVEFIEYGPAGADSVLAPEPSPSSEVTHPTSDSDDDSEGDGMSPHAGPLVVPELYQYIQPNQSGSPGSARLRTTHTAGLGDAGYKFSFDNWWPRAASSAQTPENEPQTPSRRQLDASIDSVSTAAENEALQMSPGSSGANRSPSTGNRLDFDLERSQRNMRYNALHYVATPDSFNAEEPSVRLENYHSEAIDADAFAHADFEVAYTSSHPGTPQKDSKADQESRLHLQQAETPKADPSQEFQNRAQTDSPSPGYHVVVSPSSTSSQLEVPLLVSTKERRRTASTSDSIVSVASDDTQADISLSSIDLDALKASDFVPSTPRSRPRNGGYLDPSDEHSMLEPCQVNNASLWRKPCGSESSERTPSPRKSGIVKDRIISADTLDDSLPLYSSPASGYQADMSSRSPPSNRKPRH